MKRVQHRDPTELGRRPPRGGVDPVGGLLVWATESKTATHRGDGALAAGVVKLLLDGQQRMTSLYGVAGRRSSLMAMPRRSRDCAFIWRRRPSSSTSR